MNGAALLAAKLPDDRTAALVTSPVSVRYLCGISVENAVMLVSKEESVLFAPENECRRVGGMIAGITVRTAHSKRELLELLIKFGIKRVLTEADRLSVSEFNVFKDTLHYAELDGSDLLSSELMKLREVKSERELSMINRAQEICDKAYERILGSVRKGQTERQTASLLSYYLMEYGAEDIAFPTVVLSGENTSNPYLKPSNRKIREGDFLTMEFGAKYKEFSAVMCRTVCAGTVGAAKENAYHGVVCAIADGLKVLRSGLGAKVAESVAKATLNAWSIDKYYISPFAHGIGLEINEPPLLGAGSADMLKSGNVLAVSCAVSVPGKFGIKIGDMVVITDEGCIDLTKSDKSQVRI